MPLQSEEAMAINFSITFRILCSTKSLLYCSVQGSVASPTLNKVRDWCSPKLSFKVCHRHKPRPPVGPASSGLRHATHRSGSYLGLRHHVQPRK
ncbi:hypothetical protein E2C01_044238 [Portunus trituberculatus]|uniref:Uncharacterized protein n=1 Tax=Portunus trituberculatus TaxID=210409 RepID=A0A5B7FRJ7_PORTR|nr:hypothetical protein [Portunus trituberculatus]